MDKLSQLIQEAKPLYKRRKRTRIILTCLAILIFPSLFMTSVVNLYNSGNEVYISLNNNELQDELLMDSMKLLR